MKSRKSESKRRSRGNQRRTLQNAVRSIEQLEKRELLNVDWGSPEFTGRVLFDGLDGQQEAIGLLKANYLDENSGQDPTGPEGGPNDIVALAEIEPNQGFPQAQLVPLDGNLGVNITGSVIGTDEDYFAFDLQAGDIIDAELSVGLAAIANLPVLTLHDATGRLLIGSQGVPTNPAGSPLAGSPDNPTGLADVAVHYIVKETGRFTIRVSDVGGGYNLQLRQYRPTIEQEPLGTEQILFLDFDGEFVSRELFFGPAVPGSAYLNPTRDFLPQYGIQDQDYDAFIDNIVSRTQAKFDQLAADTTNPNFSIDIRNSKDHPDPWGLPNVSRVVIGGTFGELSGVPGATGVLGIAQSVDAGNFDREETAVVMHDVFVADVNTVALDPATPRVDYVSELMAVVIAHEAGHFFGGRHQEPFNNVFGVMDQFYDPFVTSGSGNDLTFGTADDEPIIFSNDVFTSMGQFIPGGQDDTINWLGWALTTGQGNAGIVTGNVFNDLNQNRIYDPLADGGVQAVVYADVNNNGLFDEAIDFFTVSGVDGSYALAVPEGTSNIRVGTPALFRSTTGESQAVSVTTGSTVTGINFGLEVANPLITGTKFSDLNGNGARDVGEQPIEGVFVYIDLDGDDRIDIGEPAAQTAADGTYRLNFPGPGNYTIREVIDAGFVQTLPGPANNFEYNVTLTGNPTIDVSRISGLDFGNVLTVDFGDAPATYGEARHGFVPDFRLGTEWDAEQVSQFTSNATGDDVDGPLGIGGVVVDDEDGVILTRPLVAGSTSNRVAVTTTNLAGINGFLSAWADYDGNGVFDSSEQIVTDQLMPTGAGVVTDVIFAAPTGALGDTTIRFRYSAETGVGPTGQVETGEVEDYVFTTVASLDLAVSDTFSVTRNSQLNAFDVLANDFQLPGETLEIVSVSGSTAGATIQVGSTGILYSPPNGFIGQDVFTYRMRNEAGEEDEATVVVNVNLFFENPIAVDDSFDLATNSLDFPLNVLANDIEGQDGALSIINVTQPVNTTGIAGQIDIATGGKSLRYTPAFGFGGTEVFTYTVADAGGNQSTATVTVHTLPGDRSDDLVSIQLVATDLSGTPISAIQQGENFQIQVFVDDLRFEQGDLSAAAGVFAAYADVLYNLQLVSTVPNTDPTSAFNFDVSFFNDYINGQTGEATIPGIVDEFGSFTNRAAMNEPDPVLLGSITFAAQSPGVARFNPDPADESPSSDVLLFDTPNDAIPIERISYIGTSLEIVGDGAEFPIAVDDSLPNALPAGVIGFPVDVLANDVPGSTGVIQLVSTSDVGEANGTARIDDRGTPSLTDDRILYTPNVGFNGADQFTYTIQDARGIQSTATVTLRVGTADDDDIVGLRLSVTDLAGQPIDQITQGSQFQLRGFVQDLRGFGGDRGVFAAYEDVLYPAGLVSPVANTSNEFGFEVQFGPNYTRVLEGDARIPGVINEIGAVQIDNGNQPLGLAEQLLFTITLTADSVGQAEFVADPADISPLHDTLTFQPVQPVPFDQIRYGFDSLTIIGAAAGSGVAHNQSNPLDVNDDGQVTPIDPLLVINGLNSSQGSGEGENPGYFLDVNGDGVLSTIDALLGINYLNTLGSGEGEAAFDLSNIPTQQMVGTHESEDSASPNLLVDTPSTIGPRMTDYTFGPASPGVDSVLDESSDEMDDLLDDLAAEIDIAWNSRT